MDDHVITAATGIPLKQVLTLDGIDMEIRHQQFATIPGPSGCGKSTLLRVLAGLTPLTAGEALLDGKVIRGPGRERGMVFQSHTLFPWLTVLEDIKFGLRLNKGTGSDSERIAGEFIRKVVLCGFEDAYPKRLSGGVKQRVARALATDPDILLMDEPFGALDTQTRSLLQELLLQVWEELHKTVLFFTHDVEEGLCFSPTGYSSWLQGRAASRPCWKSPCRTLGTTR